jgi:hypothetical protein
MLLSSLKTSHGHGRLSVETRRCRGFGTVAAPNRSRATCCGTCECELAQKSPLRASMLQNVWRRKTHNPGRLGGYSVE